MRRYSKSGGGGGMLSKLAMLQELDIRDRDMALREAAGQRDAQMHPYQLAEQQMKPDYYQGMMQDRQNDTMLQMMDWLNQQRMSNPNYEQLVGGLDLEGMGIPQDAYMPQMTTDQILEILARHRAQQPITPDDLMRLQQTNTLPARHALSQLQRK